MDLSYKKLRPYRFLFFPIVFYFLSLFPSRIYRDSTEMLQLMRQGKSTDQWTAIYFRFCQLISINGNFPFLLSLFGLLILFSSTKYFIDSLNISDNAKRKSILFCSWTPFIGVFGMTITHEVFYVSGSLLLLGFQIRNFKPMHFLDWMKLTVALLLCLMDYLGVFFIVIYWFLKWKTWNKKILIFFIIATLFLPLYISIVLGVTSNSSGVRLGSFLGDVKCVVQHPDAVLSQRDLEYVSELAPLDKWKNPLSCANSDNAGFAWGSIQGKEIQFLEFWFKLSMKNPQIVLEARLQRASIGLPPILFSPQPNMISKNFLNPIGLGTQDDLEQWPGLFKTSNDDFFQLTKFPNFALFKIFEFIALLPAYLLNRNSDIWGWGGLWFLILFALSFQKITKDILPNINQVLVLSLSVPIGLLALSPVASPRYSWLLTFLGFTFVVSYVFSYREKNLSSG